MKAEENCTSRVTLQPCTDTALLARLYLELMEDEAHDAHKTEEAVRADMEEILHSGKTAYTFIAENRVAGYALVAADRTPPYLCHFYICRDVRRRGYGTEAFHALLQMLGTDTIDLDVFVWNKRGRAFWTSLGFMPRATIMRYQAHAHD